MNVTVEKTTFIKRRCFICAYDNGMDFVGREQRNIGSLFIIAEHWRCSKCCGEVFIDEARARNQGCVNVKPEVTQVVFKEKEDINMLKKALRAFCDDYAAMHPHHKWAMCLLIKLGTEHDKEDSPLFPRVGGGST